MKKTNQRKGFTIVELVIVIAVIAILAAVLIPTFGSVVKNAEDAAAQADARAIYTEYVAYAAEKGLEIEDGKVAVKLTKGYVIVDGGKVVKTGEKYLITESEAKTALSATSLTKFGSDTEDATDDFEIYK